MSVDTARSHMVQQQIRPQQVTHPKILEAISRTPREDFVPSDYQSLAFAETFIPLDHHQVMLLPSLEGQMLQALALKPTDKVLEIGTGSGYFTALLAKLAQHVYSIDCFENFTDEANQKLRQHHIYNATLSTGKAENGWPNHAPYNAIILTGSAPFIPTNFKQQLAIQGRLVAVVGTGPLMHLVKITRMDQTTWQEVKLLETHIPRLLEVKEPSAFSF